VLCIEHAINCLLELSSVLEYTFQVLPQGAMRLYFKDMLIAVTVAAVGAWIGYLVVMQVIVK